jgi:hypothetical protein
MSKFSDLAIEAHNQQLDELMTEYTATHQNGALCAPQCARMAIYQHPGPNKHIQNAIDHLELFILPDVTDLVSYEYVRLQLCLALKKGQTR